MAPILTPTHQINGHYANQYPSHPNGPKTTPLHLPHNKAYTLYTPNILIGLCILYAVVFLFRIALHGCRKYRDKRYQMERAQLKLGWTLAMANYQLKTEQQQKHESKTAIVCPDASYYSHNSSTSSFTLNNNNNSPPYKNYYSSVHISALGTDTRSWIQRYYKMNHNKRLALLWQWGVAAGYCEYSHAKELDHLAQRLKKSYFNSGEKEEKDEALVLDEKK